MRTLGTRRTVLVAGAAVMAAVAVAGCSAGQVAETSLRRPSNMGVNANNVGGSVLIRNLVIPYDDPTGYPKGQSAPLQLALFNQTTDEVRVTLTSSPPADGTVVTGAIKGTSVSLSGPAPSGATTSATPGATASATPGATASATPGATASATPGATASATPGADAPPPAAVITLPPSGSATFLPGDSQSLQILGLTDKLSPGGSVYVTFSFSNGAAPLTVAAPVGVPAAPAPRASGVAGENSEE